MRGAPALALCLCLSALASGRQGAKPSDALDFWVGSWKVYVQGELAGTDTVEKTLNGFAVLEQWKGSAGDRGTSFFYYMPAQKRWKQIWVTETGPYKEKLSEPYTNGIRFSGKVYLPNGRQVPDRTTLTRLREGKVHQVIQVARDGKHWITTFDAVYEPVH